MLRRSVPLLAIAVLSGCTATQQKNHQETLDAITNLETQIHGQIASMSQHIDQQNQHIAKLESKLANISKDVKFVKHKSLTEPKLIVEKQIVRVPVEEKKVDPKVANGKVVLGQEEWVWIDSIKAHFKARVDTGATTSSINAQDIQTFERDGKEWIRFNLTHQGEDNTDEKAQVAKVDEIEAPVVRWVKIRQASTEEAVRRPVVELWVQLGSLHEKAQFTLADRSQMDYPVLLGREFFKDIALVDVGKKYIQGKTEPKPEPAAVTK